MADKDNTGENSGNTGDNTGTNSTANSNAENAASAAAAAAKVDAEKVAAATKAAEDAAQQAMRDAEAKAAADRAALGNTDSELVRRLVDERLQAELAGIKEKLNAAYTARDEAQRKVAAAEAREREANLKRLAEEGKHKEAYELQLAEERAANAALAQRNIELTRDAMVRDCLREHQFRNANAMQMAFREIISNLVQDDKNNWVHRSGVSVQEYVDSFAKSEEQSFLFKAKVNSGSGSTANNGGNPAPSKPKSLFEMSQAEVIKMAEDGKLGKPKIF